MVFPEENRIAMPKNRRNLGLLETAHHEAAHAVFHLKLGLRCGGVTIRPTPDRLGHAKLKRPRWINDQPCTTRQELRLRVQAESEILALYAGRIAEEKSARSRIRSGYESDYAQIADLVGFISRGWADVESAFLEYCEKQAKLCVEQWWPEIQAVARALVERESLRPGAVMEVVAAIPLEVFEANIERLREDQEREQKRLEAAYKKKHPEPHCAEARTSLSR
jgi:hypothetical protein